jgi:DNA-directed RNA polymerase specialized sigma24 family protein
LTTHAHRALRQYVAQPATRSSLRAYVRRRGFLDDADDLVQTVLCDALAVQAVPAEAADLPRFITGIASRKVADERRRRARWKHAELPELGVTMAPEATDLLARIDADLTEPEQRRSLDWLLREHAGDSLLEIAREHALRPETLRQRICRLRRHLRAVHVWPLALLLGLGWAVASFARPRTARAPSDEAVSALAAYEGTWRVVDWAPSRYPAQGLSVVIRQGAARVHSSTGGLERDMQFQFRNEKRVTLRAGNSVWDAQVSSADAAHLKLTTARGFVELERVR